MNGVQDRFHKHEHWHRVNEGKAIAGVCTGLAHQFNAPIIIIPLRIFFSFTTIFYGIGLILYILLWFLMPSPIDTKEPPFRSKANDGEFAGFLRRVYSFVIDIFILSCLGIAIFFTLSSANILYNAGYSCFIFIMFLSAWLYFALLESSTKQATLGKKVIGIIVTDIKGNRISLLRATGRHFARILSAFPLGIGYLCTAWTKKHQALHDMVVDTVVVKNNSISEDTVRNISMWFVIILNMIGMISLVYISAR
ncbi:RDD family protein [Candidatus Latescibacterota bacterium]